VSGINVTVATNNVVGDALKVVGDASIGTDTLIGFESVRGTNFADTFDATGYNGASADIPNGTDFNEFEGLGGNDTITGSGNTRISYVSASGGVTVDLTAGTASGDPSVGTDTITGGVTRVRGSNFNDTISGDANPNILEGQGGNDVIDGRGGNDTLIGGTGADMLTGGTGNDTFVFNSAPQVQSTITDFVEGQDFLQISAAGFGHGLVAGVDPTVLTGAHADASNADGNGYFIFDNTNPNGGTLYWDATGGSGVDATAVVVLQDVAALTQSFIHVV
jgi:Ca2+-binding RTX toxin-like protein